MPLTLASAEAKDAAAAFSGPAVDLAKEAITRAAKTALFSGAAAAAAAVKLTAGAREGKEGEDVEMEEKVAGGGKVAGGEDELLSNIIAAATVSI